jgi:hypothetical protein
MKEIKIEKWKVILPDEKEVEESLLDIFSNLMSNKDPQQMPRGLDKFRIFNRIAKAFDEAEKSGTLELEEGDYSFLKNIIETDVPGFWGTNKNISKAVEEFLNVK